MAEGGRGEGAAALWLGFAGLAGVFASAAAHAAISLTGWPRVVGIAAVVVLAPLTVWFGYLARAAHYERWPEAARLGAFRSTAGIGSSALSQRSSRRSARIRTAVMRLAMARCSALV
jgi:hypothetical protein